MKGAAPVLGAAQKQRQQYPKRNIECAVPSSKTPLKAQPAEHIRELRFERDVARLHAPGERPLAEFLIELVGNDPTLAADVELLLARYSQLDPALVRALDADRFPAPPIHRVVS